MFSFVFLIKIFLLQLENGCCTFFKPITHTKKQQKTHQPKTKQKTILFTCGYLLINLLNNVTSINPIRNTFNKNCFFCNTNNLSLVDFVPDC